MTRSSAIFLLCLVPWAAPAGTSANYALTPDTLDGGGLTASSASFRATLSLTTGAAGTSASYQSRGGFAGQLGEASEVRILAGPGFLTEGGTLQLTADLVSESGTVTPFAPGILTWGTSGSPLSINSSTGLATAGAVWEDTPVIVWAASGSWVGSVSLSVRNSQPDNFGTHAADGLPDAWQVQHFGPGGTSAGPGQDPDGDGLDNLMEFAFASDPRNALSGPNRLGYLGSFEGGGTYVTTGSPFLKEVAGPGGPEVRAIFPRRRDFAAAGLVYTPFFSADLVTWLESAGPPVVLIANATSEVVSLTAPAWPEPRRARFLRFTVSKP